MKFIKATKEECNAYNTKVNEGENWNGITNNWENPQEIEGDYYISLHPKYPTELEVVDERPEVEMEGL